MQARAIRNKALQITLDHIGNAPVSWVFVDQIGVNIAIKKKISLGLLFGCGLICEID